MELRIVLKRILIVWVVVAILVAAFGKVSVAQSNAGRSAADFLTIGVGAKAAGMGGAYTAISEGAQASYWNPAGLTSIEGGEILLAHFDWYQDISLEHGSFAKKLNDKTTIGASITYLDYGTIKRYDQNGAELSNDITAYDWAGAISFGYNTSDNFSVGISAKYVNQKIDEMSGSAFAADLGFKYFANKFTLAGFLGNFGSKMKFESTQEKLPTTARIGVSFYPLSQSFMTSFEAEKSFNGNMIIRNGYEVNFEERYFIRSGINYYPDQQERSFGSGLSFGAGVCHKIAEFDYAFTTSDKYTNESLHRFSVIFKFGQ